MGMKSVVALYEKVEVSSRLLLPPSRARADKISPQHARMPQLLELDDSLVALDNLGPHSRLAERLGALGQAHEAVELGDDLDDVEPGAVVLVELAVDLLRRSVEERREVGGRGDEA